MKGIQYLPKAEDIVCLFDNVWDLKENLTSFCCLVEKRSGNNPELCNSPLENEYNICYYTEYNDGVSIPSCAGGSLLLSITYTPARREPEIHASRMMDERQRKGRKYTYEAKYMEKTCISFDACACHDGGNAAHGICCIAGGDTQGG